MRHSTKRIVGGAVIAATGFWLARAAIHSLRRYDFRGKTALITGGSRGLGLLLARRLVDAGARVAICGLDPEEIKRAREELRARGGTVVGLECDVCDQASVQQLVRTIQDSWGSVDVLVNNAGVIQVGPQSQMSLEDYRHAMDVHFWGPLYTTEAVLPQMRRRRCGRIVNISSIGGLISVPHLLPYCASKFALVGLSEGYRAALLQDGIYVTTVCPGLMRTGSTLHAQFKGQHEAEYAWFSVSGSTPMFSMDADRAAEAIIEACRNGRAHLVLSLTAQVASWIHGLAPGITCDVLGLVNTVLPQPAPGGEELRPGFTSRPGWLPSLLTRLSDTAALRNNQLAAAHHLRRPVIPTN